MQLLLPRTRPGQLPARISASGVIDELNGSPLLWVFPSQLSAIGRQRSLTAPISTVLAYRSPPDPGPAPPTPGPVPVLSPVCPPSQLTSLCTKSYNARGANKMRRFKKARFSGLAVLGTLQNPEAHRDGISNEEYQAIQDKKRREGEAAFRRFFPKDILDARAENDAKRLAQTAAQASSNASTPPVSPSSAIVVSVEQRLAASPQHASNSEPSPEQRIQPRRKRRRPPILNEPPAARLKRHQRKCWICDHEDQEDIEQDFLHWHSSTNIVDCYGIPDYRVLYRHAHATGLYEQRMKNMRFAAERIVDKAERVPATSVSVLKAMETASRITEDGVWISSPSRVYACSRADSNRHTPRLENDVTDTNETTELLSNRHKSHTSTSRSHRFGLRGRAVATARKIIRVCGLKLLALVAGVCDNFANFGERLSGSE